MGVQIWFQLSFQFFCGLYGCSQRMIMRFGKAGSCSKIYHVYEGRLWRMDRQSCACELTSMAVGQARAETAKNVCFYLFGGWEC